MATPANPPSHKRQRLEPPGSTQLPPPSYQTQPGNPAGGVGIPPPGPGNPGETLPAGPGNPADVQGVPAGNPPPGTGNPSLASGQAEKKAVRIKPGTHHVRESEWPVGYRPTKSSMELILRYLGKAFYQDAVPPAANGDDIADYNTRFDSATALNCTIQAEFINYGSYINEARAHIMEAEAKLAEVSKSKYSTIATNLGMLGEDHKLFMYECLAAAGLKRFAPDIHGSHDSMYNLAHERVALYTFRNIAARGGLAFMGCDTSLVTQHAWTSRMYRNFQFSRIRDIILREARSPGAVAGALAMSNSGKRCKALALKRKKHLVGQAFRPHTVRIVENQDSVSDEEPPPKEISVEAVQQAATASGNDPRAYIICEKEGRNEKVTTFVRALDHERRAVELRAANSRPGKMTERLRQPKIGGPAPKSARTKLPVGVPLDYYAPDYYNSLTIRERNDIAIAATFKIGLPVEELCERAHWGEWRGLDYDTFMTLHGNEQLAAYEIPTAEDMRVLAEYEKIEKELIAQLDELDMVEEELDPEANGGAAGGDRMEIVNQ
ncbi:hypothetical protein SCHPADRAFT_948074 [Schizopora paradoxa]|uniref:Uncharacterized protein n=1 Tax=Schizopora paradoxa TaxID=27342 RepID=A0A0H2R3I4_9AGAM|nr:hypothetical protein SCHPADRAFT_948074 [Schizopora paradoxa]